MDQRKCVNNLNGCRRVSADNVIIITFERVDDGYCLSNSCRMFMIRKCYGLEFSKINIDYFHSKFNDIRDCGFGHRNKRII